MIYYSKLGLPYRESQNRLFDKSGRQVGKISGRKVFRRNGKYAATIVGNRLVYLSSDSRATSSPFKPSAGESFDAMRIVPSAISGDEPEFDVK